jgi:hypothetical protein
MSQPQFFQINRPQIVSETIDGEVVIVNLDKGHYYSLVKTGSDVWERIEQGHSQERILEAMLDKYTGNSEEIQEAVNNFIHQLQEAGIIIPSATATAEVTPNSDKLSNGDGGQEKLIFEPPTLESYTDMEELLLLDPIHEVDEVEGWPARKAEGELKM